MEFQNTNSYFLIKYVNETVDVSISESLAIFNT